MTVLGNGLAAAELHADALSVQEAEMATLWRLGASEEYILTAQTNLSNTHTKMGRLEQTLQMNRDIYRGRVKLNGEEDERTLRAALNCASSLVALDHHEEAKLLLRKTMPVARRVLGKGHEVTLTMRWIYAQSLYEDAGATLDDLREAVETLADAERIARRVFGGAHPLVGEFESALQESRTTLENVK